MPPNHFGYNFLCDNKLGEKKCIHSEKKKKMIDELGVKKKFSSFLL